MVWYNKIDIYKKDVVNICSEYTKKPIEFTKITTGMTHIKDNIYLLVFKPRKSIQSIIGNEFDYCFIKIE